MAVSSVRLVGLVDALVDVLVDVLVDLGTDTVSPSSKYFKYNLQAASK